jgi:hypothetical protein
MTAAQEAKRQERHAAEVEALQGRLGEVEDAERAREEELRQARRALRQQELRALGNASSGGSSAV